MPTIRIRGGYQKHEPYPLNQFPDKMIEELGKRIVHLVAVGNEDISGDAFDQIFANAIDGKHLGRPLGIADVTWNGCCWSVKTVKQGRPHSVRQVRLISGRNSPTFSAGINNPLKDVQATGNAVLEVYNRRIEEAREKHSDIRFLVFVRNMETREFTIFERAVHPFSVNDYAWRLNSNQNLEGFQSDEHIFTWQPHGSQFTIKEEVPASATRFRIRKKPPLIKIMEVLQTIAYEDDWIEIL